MLLSPHEIAELGFARVGVDVRITRYALFFNPAGIVLGDRVRIDAFAIVAAGEQGITVGNNVHIASAALLNGSGGRIVMEDFSAAAPKVCIWTASDDYSGGTLTNPTVPDAFKNQRKGPVRLGRHVIIGTSSVILPGVCLNDGAAVGALSLVSRDVEAGLVVSGVPAKKIAVRPLDRLEKLAQEYLATLPARPC